jgi:hypothetical protein
MDNPYVINVKDKKDLGRYLTDVILERKDVIKLIKNNMSSDSTLMAFLITSLEKKLANKLSIPLHGVPEISQLYGLKSGIRRLAEKEKIPMAPGYICSKISEVEEAISILSRSFETIVIKHDLSLSGYFSKKLESKKVLDVKLHLDEISGGNFVEGRDVVVVEGWVKSKSSLCVHIEILKGEEPIICSAWQQIIHSDGISYMGAGPLILSSKAMHSLNVQVNKLANALKAKGAVGSFGPDFFVIDKGEKSLEPDTCALIELNARVPYTAFGLEIIKQVKGKIGHGFLVRHIKLSKKLAFSSIHRLLRKENLLIMEKNNKAKGVVPYNIGLLPWKLFDIVVMADSWDETLQIAKRVERLFSLS